MANSPNYGRDPNRPQPKVIENQPATSVQQALKNSQAQVDQAKGK